MRREEAYGGRQEESARIQREGKVLPESLISLLLAEKKEAEEAEHLERRGRKMCQVKLLHVNVYEMPFYICGAGQLLP